jgi:hypothetical protein
MAKKKAAKRAPAKKAAKKAPAKKAKQIDPEIMGKVIVMVKRGRSKEAVQELVESAKITEAKAHKVVFDVQSA